MVWTSLSRYRARSSSPIFRTWQQEATSMSRLGNMVRLRRTTTVSQEYRHYRRRYSFRLWVLLACSLAIRLLMIVFLSTLVLIALRVLSPYVDWLVTGTF